MVRSSALAVLVTGSLIVGGSVLACGDGEIVGPTLDVSSQVDNFQFQGGSLDELTRVLEYNWEITGTVARVVHASIVTNGTAILTMRDADGTQVYQRDLNEAGTFETDEGTAGRWLVVVDFKDASGLVRFGAQKKPDASAS